MARPLTRWVGESGVIELRVLLLERAQLAQQVVVLVVAERRVVELVVAVVGLGDQPAKLGGAFGGRAHPAVAIPSPAPSASRSQAPSRSSSPWSVRSKWIGVIATRPAATAFRSVPSSSSCEGSKP